MTGEQYVKNQMAHLRFLAQNATNPTDKAALDFAVANLAHVEHPPTVAELRAARDARV